MLSDFTDSTLYLSLFTKNILNYQYYQTGLNNYEIIGIYHTI